MVEVLAPACGDIASEPCAKSTTTGIGGEPTRFASILAAQQGAQPADIDALGASALAAEQSLAANPSLGKVLQESLESDSKLLLMGSNLPLTAASLQKKNSPEAEKSASLLAPPATIVATNIIPLTNALGIGAPQPLPDKTPSDNPSQSDTPVEKSTGEPATGQHINLTPQVIALLGPPMEKLPIAPTPSMTSSNSQAAPVMETSAAASRANQIAFAPQEAAANVNITTTAPPQPPVDETIFTTQPELTKATQPQPELTEATPAQPVMTDRMSANIAAARSDAAQTLLQNAAVDEAPVLTSNSQQAAVSRLVLPSQGNAQGNPVENMLAGNTPVNEPSQQIADRGTLAPVTPANPGEARPTLEAAALNQTLITESGEVRPQVVTARRFTNAGGESSNDLLNQLPQDFRITAAHTNATRGIEATVPQPEAAQAMRMIDQIVEKAQIGFTGGRNEIQIQLDPPELGRVQVRVSSDGGIVTTRIEVSMPEVRNLLESNMQQLRAGLEKANINIGQCSVSLTGEWGSRNMNAQHTPDAQIPRNALSNSEMQLLDTEQARPRYARDTSLTLDYFA